MESIPLYFQFEQKKSALKAFDTLKELEYNVEFLEHDHEEHLPTLLLILNQSDLTSALEIAQSHGGRLVEDYIPIPAHVVTDEEVFDPSEDSYDHFPAGIRL